MAIGLLLSLGLAAGPVRIGPIGFSLYWMLLGVTCTTLGYSSVQIGLLARAMHGLRPRFVERMQKFVTYDRGMIVSGSFIAAGLALLGHLVYRYLKLGLNLEVISHPAFFGLLLLPAWFSPKIEIDEHKCITETRSLADAAPCRLQAECDSTISQVRFELVRCCQKADFGQMITMSTSFVRVTSILLV
jgi:hypothetical protein